MSQTITLDTTGIGTGRMDIVCEHPRHGWLLALLLLICAAAQGNTPGFEASALRLTEEQRIYNIYSNRTSAHVVHDPNNRWVMKDFITGTRDYRELLHEPESTIEPQGGTYWLLLEIDNRHSKEDWRLSFRHGRTDLIEVAVWPRGKRKQAQTYRSGMRTAPAETEMAGLGYTFPVHLPAAETSVMLLRVESYLYEGSLYTRLEEAGYHKESDFIYRLWVLGCLGIMLGLTVYNIFIFLVVRDISYFWYSLFLISLTVTWSSYYGLLWSLFEWRDPARYIASYSQIGILLFNLIFTRSFLNLKQLNPVLDIIVVTAIAGLVALSVATAFVHPSYIYDAYWMIMPFCLVLVLVASVMGIFLKFRPALFLIGGHAIVVVEVFSTALSYLGILPYEDPKPERLTAIGAAEMILFSLALADRINQLQHEKRVAEQANRLKSSFLALASHEIRAPLNSLLDTTHLLSGTDLDQRQLSYVESMKEASNALLLLLNGVLDYSKLEAGRVELENCAFSIRPLIESLILLMSARAAEKGLTLSAKVDEKLPYQVTGDPHRLRQILLNLIGNGLKFTHRGTITLCVTELERDERTASIKFEVKDTGIGIAPEHQQKIFNVFSQADTSITRRFGGSGLGLNVCKHLVELMGGTLEVKSQVDRGSNFHFTLRLPYERALEAAPEPADTPERLPPLLADEA